MCNVYVLFITIQWRCPVEIPRARFYTKGGDVTELLLQANEDVLWLAVASMTSPDTCSVSFLFLVCALTIGRLIDWMTSSRTLNKTSWVVTVVFIHYSAKACVVNIRINTRVSTLHTQTRIVELWITTWSSVFRITAYFWLLASFLELLCILY